MCIPSDLSLNRCLTGSLCRDVRLTNIGRASINHRLDTRSCAKVRGACSVIVKVHPLHEVRLPMLMDVAGEASSEWLILIRYSLGSLFFCAVSRSSPNKYRKIFCFSSKGRSMKESGVFFFLFLFPEVLERTTQTLGPMFTFGRLS